MIGRRKSFLNWMLILTIICQPLLTQTAYAGRKTDALKKAAVKIISVGKDLATKVKEKASTIAPKLLDAENKAAQKLKSVAKDKAISKAESAALSKAKDEYTKDKENVEKAKKKFEKFEKITKFVIDAVKFLRKWMIKPTPGKAISKTIDFMSLLSGVETENNAFVDKFLQDATTIADGAFMAGAALAGMAAICACSGVLVGVGAAIGVGAADCFAFSAMITTAVATVKGAIYVGSVANKAWATSVDKTKSLWEKWFGKKEIEENPVDDIKDTSKEEVTIENAPDEASEDTTSSTQNSSEFAADEPMMPTASNEISNSEPTETDTYDEDDY